MILYFEKWCTIFYFFDSSKLIFTPHWREKKLNQHFTKVFVFQVAAQNCRKRKLDQINCLADEVKLMKDRKHKLLQEREFLSVEKQRVQNKYAQLYQHTIQVCRESNRVLFFLSKSSELRLIFEWNFCSHYAILAEIRILLMPLPYSTPLMAAWLWCRETRIQPIYR